MYIYIHIYILYIIYIKYMYFINIIPKYIKITGLLYTIYF